MARIIPLADVRDASRSGALAELVREAARAPVPQGPVVDQRGRGLHDLRISVTDRCNFRCTYCMPKDVFGQDYPVPSASRSARLSRRSTRVARVFRRPRACEKIRLTGGEPLLRAHLERLVAMLPRSLGPLDLTLTTNGVAPGAARPPTSPPRGSARHGQPRLARRCNVFTAMNDVDFPVAKVLEGIDAAAAAGLAPMKVNMVVKRGVNDDSIVPMARRFRGSGHIVRFIEFMDVGTTNGWRMDDVVSGARDRRRHRCADFPIEPAEAELHGRSGAAVAVPGRRRRDRRHRLGERSRSAATARGAPVDRGQALHLPLRQRRASICGRCCATAATTIRCATPSRRSGGSGRTATPRSGPRRPRKRPRSR